MPGVSIAAEANAIIALSGLRVVKLVRQAMATADKTVAAQNKAHAPASNAHPAHHSHARDSYISHQHHNHVRPSVRPTAVHRKHAAAPTHTAPACTTECTDHCARPEHQKFTVQAPWTILPYPKHSQSIHQIKKQPQQPDMQSKGGLIDIFV
jgi:hypothetical protein